MQLIIRRLLLSLALMLAAERVQADNRDIDLIVLNAGPVSADFSIDIKASGLRREKHYAFRLSASARKHIHSTIAAGATCRVTVRIRTTTRALTSREMPCATRQLVFDGRVAHIGSLSLVGAGAAGNPTHPVHHGARKRAHRHYGSSRPPAYSAEDDPRAVHFLYATNRTRTDAPGAAGPSYGYGRRNFLELGAARVRIPEAHRVGHLELPREAIKIGLITIPARNDPTKNFVVQAIQPLDREAWIKSLKDADAGEALVFVHGFNVSFERALMRTAQLIWDLDYKGQVVLFSWPSRGGARGYGYDKDSAFGARQRFVDLLTLLQGEAGIQKVSVIAHSMGNVVVVDALANYARTANPRRISELILAAPDLDQDLFRDDIASLQNIVSGITLYASSADKALKVAQEMANDRRAGQIFADQPLTLAGVDTIDVTSLGSDLFGLNHSVFAAAPPIIQDIKKLITSTPRLLPDQRWVEEDKDEKRARQPHMFGCLDGPLRFWRVNAQCADGGRGG
jgi:esterase/lipase superfamily enzyme